MFFMFSKNFFNFVKEKSDFLSKKWDENWLSENELMLTQMIKLSEEVWELSQLLVASQKMQRDEKNELFRYLFIVLLTINMINLIKPFNIYKNFRELIFNFYTELLEKYKLNDNKRW